MTSEHDAEPATLSAEQIGALLLSVFVVAICGLSYELMMGALATTLLGSSIVWFSLTIGIFLSSMGLGSFLSRYVHGRLLLWFVLVEISVGILGGVSGLVVFLAYTHTPWVQVALFGQLALIGVLCGLEIPLLTRFLHPIGGLRTAIANVLALDYVGSLIASLAFPFIMLPWLGLLESFFAVGLLNLLAASVTAVAFADRLPMRALGAVVLLAAAGLAGGLATAEQTMSSFERRLYADQVIHVEQSPYQRIVLTKRGDDVRLYLDGHLQLSARDEFRYHESLVHPAMQLAANRRRVLLLGAGDGLAAREVLSFDGVESLTLVDLDPAITRLASTHHELRALNAGSLQDPRVTVVNDDAFTWLTNDGGFYDVILMDFPDPHDDGLAKLYSTAMYGLVRSHLAPGGVGVTQASSPYFAREAYWTIHHTIERAGLVAVPYHAYVPAFGEWGFVLFSATPVDWSRLRPRPGARFLDQAQLRAAIAFPADMAPVPVEPSTLDRPRVFERYRKGLEHWF